MNLICLTFSTVTIFELCITYVVWQVFAKIMQLKKESCRTRSFLALHVFYTCSARKLLVLLNLEDEHNTGY